MVGVKFGKYHSEYDFGMILTHTDIGNPPLKTTSVDIPGSDGSLDLSEYFGGPKFGNRILKFYFCKKNQKGCSSTFQSTLRQSLLGEDMEIKLDEDIEYLYYGKVTDITFSIKKNMLDIAVTCSVEPFKKKYTASQISAIADAQVQEILIPNIQMPTIPQIFSAGRIIVKKKESKYGIITEPGEVIEPPEVELQKGDNTILIQADINYGLEYVGDLILIRWREGRL